MTALRHVCPKCASGFLGDQAKFCPNCGGPTFKVEPVVRPLIDDPEKVKKLRILISCALCGTLPQLLSPKDWSEAESAVYPDIKYPGWERDMQNAQDQLNALKQQDHERIQEYSKLLSVALMTYLDNTYKK